MIHTFTPEFYFHTSISNHTEHKSILLPKLEQDSRAYRDTSHGSGTTSSRLNNYDLFHTEFVEDVIWKPFNQMLTEFDDRFNKLKIHSSKIIGIWWNHYQPYEVCNPHRHYGSDFTGIYLLHLEEPNSTKFLPTNNSANTYPLFDNIVGSEQCKEGDVLIFPGKILHWTTPVSTTRWAVVFDFKVEVDTSSGYL
jgi:hypothetical protein